MDTNWSDMSLKERIDYLLNQLQISNDKIANLEERVNELEK